MSSLENALYKKDHHMLFDSMSGSADQSITIHNIHAVLNTGCSDAKALEAIFDGASQGGEEAMRMLQEAKTWTDSYGAIPGFKSFQKATIKLLLDGVDLENDNFCTAYGSPLHYACNRDNTELVEYLIENQFPPYTENSEGLTVLDMAWTEGNDEIGILLLEANVDPNHVNSNGLCPLNYAIKNDHLEMAKALIRYGAKVDLEGTSEPILISAVNSRNQEITKCFCEDPKFNPTAKDLMEPLCLAIQQGYVPIIELLVEKGGNPNQVIHYPDENEFWVYGVREGRHYTLLQTAITGNQFKAFALLLSKGAEFSISEIRSVFQHICRNDATNILSCLLNTKPILFISEEIIFAFLTKFIFFRSTRCSDLFIKHLSDNGICNTSELLLQSHSQFKDFERNILEQAAETCEAIFVVLLKHVNFDAIVNKPSIYHLLLEKKHYTGLKVLMDKSVTINEDNNEIELKLHFLNSCQNEVQSSGSPDSKLAQSFLHKLNSCPSTQIKFHPLVNAAVAKKLSVYRWWYVITLLLYCLFLSALYYALINASYQCDAMLFSYEGSSGAFRAVCEVVVLIYAILFSMDECMELAVIFIRFSYQEFNTMNLLKAIQHINNRRLLISKIPSLLIKYFVVFNNIDLLGLVALFFLIIFRVTNSPFQWTLASLTCILFTLRLFKYTRIIPSLGSYVHSIFQIFVYDISQFAVIIVIIMLAYFGGIHLAARQTFASPASTNFQLYSGQNCSNRSLTDLFWFDQERTNSYDLRRPLLSGIIFLLDGGPANEENGLLNSNFLFALLYLAFAFTIIVVMSNILIAQLSQTYGEITKNSELPFRLDLVVSVEYESNLAFFFGKYLRNYTYERILTFDPLKWKEFSGSDTQEAILLRVEETANNLSTQMDHNLKTSTNAIDDMKDEISNVQQVISNVQQDISNMKQDISRGSQDIAKRMDCLEGMVIQVLDLLKHSPATN